MFRLLKKPVSLNEKNSNPTHKLLGDKSKIRYSYAKCKSNNSIIQFLPEFHFVEIFGYSRHRVVSYIKGRKSCLQ